MTRRNITIDDIIAAEGDRIPNASTSQKNFKTAFVLLTRPGTFTSDVLPGIETIRNAWAGRFTQLTNGKGTIMDVTPSITIAIGSPSNGETINKPSVTVKGAVINNTGNETGVTVNLPTGQAGGIVATVYGSQFIVNSVPLTEGTNTITVTATDTAGSTTSTSLTVNAITTGNYIKLSSNIESGIAPLEVTLKIDGSFSIDESTISGTGPAQPEFLYSSADEYRVRMIVEGIYYFTASVTGPGSIVYQDTIAIIVLNKTQLDNLLRGKWEAIKTALMTGNIEEAVSYFVDGAQDRFRNVFTQLGNNKINSIFSSINEIKLESVYGQLANYGAIRIESGGTYSYPVVFVKDENGIWMIMGF